MGNRFFYNMPPTVAIERLNEFDEEVQVAAGAAVEAAAAASAATAKAGEAASSAAAAAGSAAAATSKAGEAAGSATAAGTKAADAAASAAAAAGSASTAGAKAAEAVDRAAAATIKAGEALASASAAAGSAATAGITAAEASASAAAAAAAASAAAASAADAHSDAAAIEGTLDDAGQVLAAAQQAAADINANIAGAASNAAAAQLSATAAEASAAGADADAAAAQASAASAAGSASFASDEADRAQAAADTATEGQVQADWAETDPLEKSFIQNKPVQFGRFELPANTGSGWTRLGCFTAKRSGELLFIRMLGAPVIGGALWDTELALRTRDLVPPAFPGHAVYTYANRNPGPGAHNPASIKIKAVGADPEATGYEVWIYYGLGGATVPGFYEVSLTPSARWTHDVLANQDDPGSASEFVLPAIVVTPSWHGVMTTASFGNVQNTLDLDKPVSTATQAALDLKANLASPAFTGTVSGITAAMVGLPNVENKSSATMRSELTAANVTNALAGSLTLAHATAPQIVLKDTNAGTDQGAFAFWVQDGGAYAYLGKQTDAGAGIAALSLDRNGNTASAGVHQAQALVTSAANGLRMKNDGGPNRYAVIQRNDGAYYALMMTAANDQDGSFNSLRPFAINLATGDVALGHNVTIAGNLVVNGTSTQVNSTTVTVDDPVITLGGDTAPTMADGKDRGVEMRYYSGGSARIAFMGYDASADRFAFLINANSTGEIFSGTKGTLDANLAGDVTGNVTGNVTGTAANVTGTIAVANGGTGATSATAAAANLGLGTANTPVFSGAVLSSAYPNLRFQETDAASGERFARIDFTGGVMKVQRLGDDGVTWTSDMLSLSLAGVLGISTVNAAALNGNALALSAAAPAIRFTESDMAGSLGAWRQLLDNDVLRIDRNTAAAKDFSTFATALRLDASSVILGAPLVGPVLRGEASQHVDKGTVSSGTVTFDYRNGISQRVQVGGPLTIAFDQWPAGSDQRAFLMIEIVNGNAGAITMPAIQWVLPDGSKTSSMASYMAAIGRTALQSSGSDFFVFWKIGGASEIYGKMV